MSYPIHFLLRAGAALSASLMLMASASALAAECVPVGAWVALNPSGLKPVASNELLARLARQSVVLLGESHDSAEDHRWQLQTLTAFHALRPDMVLAFEMFPRRVQSVLDRWVAGDYTEAQFLKAVDWNHVWNFESRLYLPIFSFARMNRVPMVAMNVGRALVRAVRATGLDAVAAELREGITKPAAPSAAYVDALIEVYRDHLADASPEKAVDRKDPAFLRFVESQQLWDRAMAQAIAQAAARASAPLVVGILGRGHVVQGHGVPHQLRDLGVKNISSLLPSAQAADCKELVAGYADAIFGVAADARTETAAERPRLGVRIETTGGDLRVAAVEKDSIADAAGVRDGDIVSEAAGVVVKEFAQLIAIIQRQAAGTWLPLKVRRQNETLELIAKFPAIKS